MAIAAVTQLHDARVLLQTLLDQLPERIAISYGPPDLSIIPGSRRLAGLSMVAAPGVDILNGLSDGVTSRRAYRLRLYRASRFGETMRNEELMVARSHGTRIAVLVDGSPIRPAAGRIVGRHDPLARCGRVCFDKRKINLSQVFARQNVGVKQIAGRVWLVSFMHHDLGWFDDETCRLQPADDPFQAKVLPMSPVRTLD